MTGSRLSEEMDEFQAIDRYFRPLAEDENAFQLKDDAAHLAVPEGHDLVVTKDVLVSDVHFFADDPPELIAKKALRTNVSDLLGKGATPYRYSLGLVLNASCGSTFFQAFSRGLAADQAHYGWSLIGGDTTKTSDGSLVVSITAYGLCPSGKMVTRLGANVGDKVYVSGIIGASSLGLLARQNNAFAETLNDETRDRLFEAYLLPTPPKGIEDAISSHASAAMDISDGLMADLHHLCRASGVGAKIERSLIPLPNGINVSDENLVQHALTGGDDYQCLVCVSPRSEAAFMADCAQKSIKVTSIGALVDDANHEVVLLHNGHTQKYKQGGYRHF